MAHAIFRFLSRALALLPIQDGQRDRLKALVYRHAGTLFERSPNYHHWKRGHPDRQPRMRWPRLEAPSEAEWRALAPAPAGDRGGQPFVVVPVYRGEAETLACLYAVRSTAPDVRLVVVDDATPERGLARRLDALAADGHFLLLRNERNLGFLRSVERGLAFDPIADGVLVNSDAIVSGDWLARLRAAACRAPDIGTVTPLSNHGDLASYPHPRHEQSARLELDLDAIDQLASRVNAGRVVDAPTGVGFCLYLRRDCLNAIGGFDAAFANGYGEETDLCLRAAAAGWRSVVATDVLVRHEGGRSFGTRALRLREAAAGRLKERHPEFEPDVERFYSVDPLREARLRLDAARLLRAAEASGRIDRAVLFVSHDWGGGIEEHLERLAQRLADRSIGVFVLRLDAQAGQLRANLAGRPGEPSLEDLGPASSLRSDDLPALIDALRMMRIDHVHLHAVGHAGDRGAEFVVRMAAGLRVPFDVTIHDYLAICPRFHLVDEAGRYCGEPDEDGCRACLEDRGSQFGAVDIGAWRTGWGELLRSADRVICPVEDVRARLASRWPDLRYEVHGHPEPVGTTARAASPASHDSTEAMEDVRVLVPGAITDQKGFRVICAAAAEARARSLPLSFVVVGYTRDDGAARRAGLRVTGPFDPVDADRSLLAEAGAGALVLLPSVAPETWGTTLSSAWRIGLHPVVFDLGALAERIRATGRGTVLPQSVANSPAALTEALIGLRAEAEGGVPLAGAEETPASCDAYRGLAPRPTRRPVFLDRDGVLSIHTSGYVRTLDEWHPIPRSLAAVARLSRAGHPVVVLTNQSGVGRGLIEEAALDAIHRRLREQVVAAGGRVDGLFFCPHPPDAQCECRKPAPGLFHQAEAALGLSPRAAPFVGDRWTDVLAATAAGARPILVGGHAGERPSAAPLGVERFPDLSAFVEAFLDEP